MTQGSEPQKVPFNPQAGPVNIPHEVVQKLVDAGLVYQHPTKEEALAPAEFTPHAALVLLTVLRNVLDGVIVEGKADETVPGRMMVKAMEIGIEDALHMVSLMTQIAYPKPEDPTVRPGFFDGPHTSN